MPHKNSRTSLSFSNENFSKRRINSTDCITQSYLRSIFEGNESEIAENRFD